MLDWNEYRTDLKKRISEIGKPSPDTATLGAAGAQTSHLDAKTRELIALAVAVTVRCDGCITVHVDATERCAFQRSESDHHATVAARITCRRFVAAERTSTAVLASMVSSPK